MTEERSGIWTLPSVAGRNVTGLVALTLAYTAAALVGLIWARIEGAGSPVWPAAGIGLAGLLIGGIELWPAIFVGRLLAAVLTGSEQPFLADVAIAVGNALSTVAAMLAFRRMPVDIDLASVTSMGRYIVLGAGLSSIVAAIVGTATVYVSSHLTAEEALDAFVLWTFGSFAGVIIVGPLVQSWWMNHRLERPAQLLVIVAVVTAAGALLLNTSSHSAIYRSWHVLPLFIWAALAYQVRGASLALFISFAISVWGASKGIVTFTNPDLPPDAQVSALQQFISITSFAVLLLAAFDDERRQQGANRLRLALDATEQGIFELDVARNTWRWDPQTRRLFGASDTEQVAPFERMLELTYDLDRPHLRECLGSALDPTGDGWYTVEFRVEPSPGEIRWLSMTGQTTFEGFRRNRAAISSLGTVRDISEQKAAEERQRLLLRELSHRVKNSLAVIQSISRQTLRNSPDPKEFAAIFQGRIASLAASHSLLTNTDWRGADLAEVIHSQLGPIVEDQRHRLHLDGPAVLLPAETATQLGLVLHELGTNAAKHGAFSNDTGTVAIRWYRTNGQLNLEWIERGGPQIEAEPPRKGFGSTLIERMSVNGFERTFAREGVTIRLAVRLQPVSDHTGPA